MSKKGKRGISKTNRAAPLPSGDAKLLLPGRKAKDLKLNFAGNIVKHLGVQMYAGRPVPAIAELISNSWDADANEVKVRIPLDEPWEHDNENQIIEIEDNGNGMTWEIVKDAYLDVGRDRREQEKTDKSQGGRPLQGRKGIGKLAGFGIADILEVQTVHVGKVKEIGEQALIWFRLSADELKKTPKDAPVELIYAGPVSKAPVGGRRVKGTLVTLRRLREQKAQNSIHFHWSMVQRFLVFGPKFRVTINDEDLKPEDLQLQWRWPETGWADDEVEGCGPVKYWIGFTKETRKQNEGELSGILIYTRGKISQESTFFEISGGVTGQHGLRYMVGMVKAEWLDAGLDHPDRIATPRDAIEWESPQGQAFKKWGQSLVKKYLAEWAKLRTAEREKHVRELSPEIQRRLDNLSSAYRSAATRFIDTFKSVEMETEEFESLLSWFLDALENATLRSIFEKLRQTEGADLEELDKLLSKMEIRTAVALLNIIDSNITAIQTLKNMHLENAKERGVISTHLEKNPWLIHPTWVLHSKEKRVSRWIEDEFGLNKTNDPDDLKRVDFFCVGVGGTLHIVEIKRGGHEATTDDILQADRYRSYVERRFKEITDPEAIKYSRTQAHLVAAKLKDDDAARLAETYGDKGWVLNTTWSDLIERAERAHHQFRKELKLTAEAPEPGYE